MGDDVFASGALSDAYLLFGSAQAVKIGDGFLFVVIRNISVQRFW